MLVIRLISHEASQEVLTSLRDVTDIVVILNLFELQ